MQFKTFEKVIHLLTHEHQVRITAGREWSTNVDKKEIQYVYEDIEYLPELTVLGLILHEISHIHNTTPIDTSNVKLPPLTAFINHQIEDIATNKIMGEKYRNSKQILEDTIQEQIDETLDQLDDETDKTVTKYEKAIYYSTIKYHGRGYKKSIEDYEEAGEQIANFIKTKEKQISARAETEELLPITEEIKKILFDELGEPTEKEVSQMQTNLSNFITQPGEDKSKPVGTLNIPKSKIQDKVTKAIMAKNGYETGENNNNVRITEVTDITGKAQMVGTKIRNILKRNNASRFEGKFRSGKLITRKLVRAKTNQDGKIFAKKIIMGNQSYAFTIIIDASGSMFERNKMSYSISTAKMIAEALRIANIPRSLFAFSDESARITNCDTKKLSWNKATHRDTIGKIMDHGTYPAPAIRTGIKDLKNQKVQRRIMIILTDGEFYAGDVEEAIQEAHKNKIETLGITIRISTS